MIVGLSFTPHKSCTFRCRLGANESVGPLRGPAVVSAASGLSDAHREVWDTSRGGCRRDSAVQSNTCPVEHVPGSAKVTVSDAKCVTRVTNTHTHAGSSIFASHYCLPTLYLHSSLVEAVVQTDPPSLFINPHISRASSSSQLCIFILCSQMSCEPQRQINNNKGCQIRTLEATLGAQVMKK